MTTEYNTVVTDTKEADNEVVPLHIPKDEMASPELLAEYRKLLTKEGFNNGH